MIISWAIIALFVAAIYGGMVYQRSQTAPIRKATCAYVQGAVKNGTLSREEGERYMRYMERCRVGVERAERRARKVRSEVDAAYQRQHYQPRMYGLMK